MKSLPSLLRYCAPVALLLASFFIFAAQPLTFGEVRTVLTLPAGAHPEGIAVDKDGSIYVANRYVNSESRKINEILKIDRDDSLKLYAELPSSDLSDEGLLGLAIDDDAGLFAALVTSDMATRGIYRISHGGNTVVRLENSEAIQFPNALTFDDAGHLYVTDSGPGKIWKFADKHAAASLWIADPLLQPLATDPLGISLPGANGIAFYRSGHDRMLFVANTEKGLILCIPFLADGSAGVPQILASGLQILTVDGIAADPHGDIHAVVPGYLLLGTRPLVRIDGDTGEITPEVTDASEIARFDVPLSIAFGKAFDTSTVFITNGDLPVAPGGPGPGVVQVGIRANASH